MIYIKDYSKLKIDKTWDVSKLIGTAISVRTAADHFRGILITDECDKITLTHICKTCGKTGKRKIVISKKHIVAIESCLC